MLKLGYEDMNIFTLSIFVYLDLIAMTGSKYIGPVKQIIAIIFLPISLNMCFGSSKEPSH